MSPENMTAEPEARDREHPGRCQVGACTPQPCWREATEVAFGDPSEGLPVCAEHKRHIEVGYELDERLTALYKIQEWIDTEVKPDPPETILQGYVYAMRERAERDLWPAAVSDKAHKLIANRSPNEESITLQQAERVAELTLRYESLMGARAILEDVPEEALGGESRWEVMVALLMLSDGLRGELEHHRREIGRKA